MGKNLYLLENIFLSTFWKVPASFFIPIWHENKMSGIP